MKDDLSPIRQPASEPEEPKAISGSAVAVHASVKAEYFAGPLPPPELLARYNDIIPNGAERILAMAERQSAHRETLEREVVRGNLASQRRGSIFAFVLALVAIAGGIWLIDVGRNISGLATVISAMGGLASVFYMTQKRQNQERAEKAAALAERRRR